MEVILLEKVAKLGGLGDKVKVKSGFGRNYLLPYGKAVVATANNIADFNERRAELEANAKLGLEKSQQRAAKLENIKVTIAARAGDENKLYGSVGVSEIAKVISTAASIEVQKKEIQLPGGPIRLLGEHEIILMLHGHLQVSVTLTVVAAEDK